LFETCYRWRYSLWAANLPADTKGWRGQCAYIDAGHWVGARAEDVIRTGRGTGLGHSPSLDDKVNETWLDASMTARILPCWLRLLALDGKLARGWNLFDKVAVIFWPHDPTFCILGVIKLEVIARSLKVYEVGETPAANRGKSRDRPRKPAARG
jgi:hypothetical protein